MSNTVNKAHFSRMCGVSKAAITKAEANGLIAMKDGKVNLDRKVTKDYLEKQLAKNAAKEEPVAAQPKSTRKKPGPKAKPKTPPPEQPPEPKQFPLIKSLDDINEENISLLSKGDVDKFNSWEKALKTRLDREEKRGLLIPRSSVRQVFAKLYAIDTNQWRTLEDRLIPELCGVFGFQDGCPESFKAREMLSGEVIKTLRHVKRLMDDFLVKNKEEKI